MPPFSFKFFLSVFGHVLPYLPITLFVIITSIIFSSLLGALIARGQLGESAIWRPLSQGYVFVLRSTPPIVLLFLVFYGLPKLLLLTLNININDWQKPIFVIVALSLLFASNLAEVFKAAYLSVNAGQREAALMAGLSEWQGFYRITLPQTIVVALPNFANTVAALIKDAALAYVIGLLDMMGAGDNLISINYGQHTLETYLALTIIYWIMFAFIEQGAKYLERYFGKGRIPASNPAEVIA
ncbi:amino acid ABC transporter permease [Leuconostoc carnosum]|uniref:amino acid ABC transporter permease n=1 Tax=Leuconostoc carnosum TaxID=1252 RepID=UPI001239DF41|nr:amino acid ABC transporter permease [Leuconostoc carnosum]KAA8371444.1 amino acid ABC transporter permease [Leuconostoc carnosum]KAA8383165.1 amino acid ABC transporter permease [Leuconostoc carnosum]